MVKARYKCVKHHKEILDDFKGITFQIAKTNFVEWDKLWAMIKKVMEYVALQKNVGNPIIDDLFRI